LAMAVTGFFRALGGAVGAAILGAVFAAQVGQAGTGTVALSHAGRLDVISGIQAVFLAAAPLALIALVAVLAIREVPLQGPGSAPRNAAPRREAAGDPAAAGAAR
ncbi:MAG: EmrB/QacA family drug resistance transporter, partial [Solirubrobacteraceae bacterium]